MLSHFSNLIKRLRRRAMLSAQIAQQRTHFMAIEPTIDELPFSLPATLPGGRPWPKISVITPSFNQGRFIAETIESVINQDYPNVEHIVIDGGSTDNTMTIVNRYRSHLAHVISESDRGQSDALNKGFGLATGEILCWLNSDDQFAPMALAAVAMAFHTTGADVVSGICEVYDNGRLVHRHMSACVNGKLPISDLLDLDNGWNAGQFFYQPEVFFTRDLWERAGAHVREDCYYSMDYELWCRFAFSGANFHALGAPLARFRLHSEQKTADPSKFKVELVSVRDRFAAEHGIGVCRSARPAARFDRKLRVAMVNDLGARYGAGIAHARMAAGIDMAGHTAEMFELSAYTTPNGKPDEHALVETVIRFDPDVVIFGNLHSATRDSIATVEALSARFPSFWVTHDFWLFTGRCAYPEKCEKYVTGCDSTCPTASKYPDLSADRIANAWKMKQVMLASDHSPHLLGNSTWSVSWALSALSRLRSDAGSRVTRVQLGAPVHMIKPMKKSAARSALGINPEHFVVAFSVSSLAEERKGGHLLAEAIRGIGLPNISVLLIGNLDVPFEAEGVEIVSLGYVTEPSTLNAALSAADVYVGPSIEETFGQVFIEAALAGTPSIGFDQTGVRDSIVDGVTGLRINCSSTGLREAIIRLYRDRDYCDSLGRWARIYALNEFSLESSFHSLFAIWRKLGLIDRWELPHKVGFERASAYVDESLSTTPSWRGVHGVSATEGPYPQFGLPTTFQWCHGAQSRLVVHCPSNGRYLVQPFYFSSLFDSLVVQVLANGQSIGTVSILRTDAGKSKCVEFFIDAKAGGNIIDLLPDQMMTPTAQEPRALTFMLQVVQLKNAEMS